MSATISGLRAYEYLMANAALALLEDGSAANEYDIYDIPNLIGKASSYALSEIIQHLMELEAADAEGEK